MKCTKYVPSFLFLSRGTHFTSFKEEGQLISEGNFGFFKTPKKWTFFVRISALASKTRDRVLDDTWWAWYNCHSFFRSDPF